MRIFQMQRISAIAIVFFLTLHMVVVHYPADREITSDVVFDRLEQPLWKAVDIAFLFFVLVHALTGTYMVITDMERFAAYQRTIGGAALALGAVAFIYGALTVITF